jgi:hypothetical protein
MQTIERKRDRQTDRNRYRQREPKKERKREIVFNSKIIDQVTSSVG